MRYLILFIGFCWSCTLPGQSSPGREQAAAAYLDSIRTDRARLRAFFADMPKGGDLHHHFEGSIFAETILEGVRNSDYWINVETLSIRPDRPRRNRRPWKSIRSLVKDGTFSQYRRPLLRKWSVLDYEQLPDVPSDQHFFGAFVEFLPLVPLVIPQGLLNLKARAKAENVQYLETIFVPYRCPEVAFRYPQNTDALLRYIQEKRDADGLFQTFDIIYEELEKNGLEACARSHNRWVHYLHDSLQLDDDQFRIRYQNYVLRVKSPTEVFADLAVNFESAANSPLVVSVNIVAPEHDPVALQDYWLHMQMYRYLSEKYPGVKKSLHAGELTLGMTVPEALRWHVRSAVEIAGADRIGHGVDLPFEADWKDLIRKMREADIPVELNLSSNAFILGVEGDEHPLSLYYHHGVPLLVCTDDAGVLRSSLTEQFVLLAYQYPYIRYKDIKEMVFHSIRYSFLEDPALKEAIYAQLTKAFDEFERSLLKEN